MMGLGIVGFVSGDFASVWQRAEIADPSARTFLAYACAAIEFAASVCTFVPIASALTF